MKTSEKIDQLLPDLFKVKASILPLKKEAENPYFNSSYVDLNGVLAGVEDILSANNFILLQPVTGRVVETILLHKSGQFVSSDMELVLDKNTMQALGSAVSYSRRYSLVSLLGLKSVDDDGNGATFEKAPATKYNAKTDSKPASYKPTASTAKIVEPTAGKVADIVAPTETKPVTKAAPKVAAFHRPSAAAKPASNGSASQFD